MSDKLCLQWNDFKENVITAYGSLREDNDFADVTLACEDGQQVEVHKVILATSSPFFKMLLGRNKHPHPLIYMRGVKYANLLAILEFLYRGEANLFQDDLDSFLAIAEELQLKGLTGTSERFEDSNRDEKYFLEQSVPDIKNEISNQVISQKIQNHAKPGENKILALPANSSLSVPGNLSVDLVELEEKVKSMMQKSQNKNGNGRGFAFVCKVCGKEGLSHNIKDHIEANHLEGVVIPCNFCDKTFRCKNTVRMHIKRQYQLQLFCV